MTYHQVEENIYELVVFLPVIRKQLSTGTILNTIKKKKKTHSDSKLRQLALSLFTIKMLFHPLMF